MDTRAAFQQSDSLADGTAWFADTAIWSRQPVEDEAFDGLAKDAFGGGVHRSGSPGVSSILPSRWAATEVVELEIERKRIAQALHDELGQSLAALHMDLVAAKQIGTHDSAMRELIVRMEAVTVQATTEMRRIISALCPQQLEELGIAAAAAALLRDWSQRSGVWATLAIHGLDENSQALSPATELVLFRSLQESLTNVSKHADASAVAVMLNCDEDRVRLQIRDDGVGIDQALQRRCGAFGLLGMIERARALGGTVTIETARGAGATIEVTLPYS